MVQRAGVQPETARLIAPRLVDRPFQEVLPQSLADELGHEAELYDFDFALAASVQFRKAGGDPVDVKDVDELHLFDNASAETTPAPKKARRKKRR